jgi:hypothetical protein
VPPREHLVEHRWICGRDPRNLDELPLPVPVGADLGASK